MIGKKNCLGAGALLLLLSPPSQAASPARTGLQKKLEQVFSDSRLEKFKWGAHVIRLSDGVAVYSHQENQLFIPASTVKILTAASALRSLGPESTFNTTVFRDGDRLWIKGGGDPSLVTERLFLLAQDIRANWPGRSTKKKISKICTDQTALPLPELKEARRTEDTDRAFNAPLGALNLNYNAIRVHLLGGVRSGDRVQARVEPANSSFAFFSEKLKTSSSPATATLTFDRTVTAQRDEIRATGSAPPGEKIRYFNVTRPAQYAAAVLGEFLRKEGFTITDTNLCDGTVPSRAEKIAELASFPLSQIVTLMNKYSNNFIAEALSRRMGGLEAVVAPWRSLVGGADVHLASASGLERESRLSPAFTTHLLRVLSTEASVFPELLGSMPINGRDGTLRDRLPRGPNGSTFRAKTGSLDGVDALVGMTQTKSGKLYAFAVFLNTSEPQIIDARFWERPFAEALLNSEE